MSIGSWKTILTAVAKGEGKTLREWSDDCEEQAARLVAAIPAHMRKPEHRDLSEPGNGLCSCGAKPIAGEHIPTWWRKHARAAGVAA